MFLDALLKIVDNQAVTASAAGNNVLDLGAARDLFNGEPMCLLLVPKVSADFTTGDETYGVKLQSDDNSAFSSATDLMGNMPIPAAQLAVGKTVIVPLPAATYERYLRAYFTTGGTTPTLTVDAYIMPTDLVSKLKQGEYAMGYKITG